MPEFYGEYRDCTLTQRCPLWECRKAKKTLQKDLLILLPLALRQGKGNLKISLVGLRSLRKAAAYQKVLNG